MKVTTLQRLLILSDFKKAGVSTLKLAKRWRVDVKDIEQIIRQRLKDHDKKRKAK